MFQALAVSYPLSFLDKGLFVIDSAQRILASASDFKREIENLRGKFVAIMLNLEFIVDTFVDLISWGSDIITNPKEQFRGLQQISDFRNNIISGIAIASDSNYPANQIKDFIGDRFENNNIGIGRCNLECYYTINGAE